jgi:hypothetical protein
MVNGLSGSIAAVHPDVKSPHRSILLHYLGPNPIEQLIDRPALWLKQIEEGRSMTLRYYKAVQLRNWKVIPDGEGERI